MFRYCYPFVFFLILLVSCTRTTPLYEKPEDIYRYVWERPDSALSQLQQTACNDTTVQGDMLYRLTYSIASSRSGTDNPYTDLHEVIDYFRNTHQQSYLFVAIIQQAKLYGRDGKVKEALQLIQEASGMEQSTQPVRVRSLYHSIYAFLLRRSGDYENALEHYARSQAINQKEGFTELLVSNAINLVNLPNAVAIDTLDRFISFYEPYVSKALPEQQRKFYNNIGNEYKWNGDTLSALRMYRHSLESDPNGTPVRSQLNYAQLLDHYGHTELAESLYHIVFIHADSLVSHRLYHHLTTRSMERGDIRQARRYMNIYLKAINHIYETRERKELMEMQAKYERSELLRKAEHNRNIVLQSLLSFVVISIIGYIIYALSRIYQCYRLGYYLNEYCLLMRKYRTARHKSQFTEQHERKQEEEHKKRLNVLMERINDLMKETNRFRTIYRIKTPHITVTPQDISALNLYLQLSDGKMKYTASQHRSTLYHWLNLTDDHFAERFTQAYPNLSPHDMDLCCFYRLGFDNDHISGLYGQYSDSVRRHRQRLYSLLEVAGKESLDHLIHNF